MKGLILAIVAMIGLNPVAHAQSSSVKLVRSLIEEKREELERDQKALNQMYEKLNELRKTKRVAKKDYQASFDGFMAGFTGLSGTILLAGLIKQPRSKRTQVILAASGLISVTAMAIRGYSAAEGWGKLAKLERAMDETKKAIESYAEEIANDLIELDRLYEKLAFGINDGFERK